MVLLYFPEEKIASLEQELANANDLLSAMKSQGKLENLTYTFILAISVDNSLIFLRKKFLTFHVK